MDTKQFWQLIEESRVKSGGDCEAQCDAQSERLQKSLSLLTAEDIAAFDNTFDRYRKSAYRWDLWGVAVLINGGASDDGFEYFCRWLIEPGQKLFEAALAEPDNLADLITDNIFWGDGQLDCEALGYAAMEAYEKKTGREMPDEGYQPWPEGPGGTKWSDENLDALYPKITAKINAQSMRSASEKLED